MPAPGRLRLTLRDAGDLALTLQVRAHRGTDKVAGNKAGANRSPDYKPGVSWPRKSRAPAAPRQPAAGRDHGHRGRLGRPGALRLLLAKV